MAKNKVMPRIVGIFNRKGGCGKSTTTINLTSWLAHIKMKVLIVDADNPQHSSARTAHEYGHDFREVKDADQLSEVVETAEGYDAIVIDGPGHDSELIRAGITLSDLVLIPSRTSAFDVEGAVQTLRMVRYGQKLNPRMVAGVFFNEVKPSTIIYRDAVEILSSPEAHEKAEFRLFDNYVPDRTTVKEGVPIYSMTESRSRDLRESYSRLFQEAFDFYSSKVGKHG